MTTPPEAHTGPIFVGDKTAYNLAAMADTYSPDSDTSPGAEWLRHVARDVEVMLSDLADTFEGGTDAYELSDEITERADQLVPIYTHERWQVFVDLGAYNEDTHGELGDDGSDLTQSAAYALYMIAQRLMFALVEEAIEAREDDDDDDE